MQLLVVFRDIGFKLSDFNILRFYKHLKREWYIIAGISVSLAVIMLVVAFNSPDKFRSQAVLAPADQSSSGGLSGLASQLGGVASLAGVNLGSGGADKTIEAIETLKSKVFLNEFIDKYDLKVFIMGVDGWDIVNDTPVYSDEYDPDTNHWHRDVKFPKKDEPSSFEVSDYFLKNNLSINTVADTGYTVLEVVHFSPLLAKQIAENLVLEVNNKIKQRDIELSKKTLVFLTEALGDTKITEIKQQIYMMMEQQLQTQMLASVKDNYVFKVIDMPYVAEERFSPNRVLMCLLGLILGSFIGFLVSLTRFVSSEVSITRVEK